MRRFTPLIIGILLIFNLSAQNVAYYNSINTSATGSSLETALTNLITTTHTTNISYSTAFQLLKDANEDPNNTANVILIYSGLSDPKTNSYGGGGTGTASTGWTREHIFPKSLANPSLGTTGSGADAHNLAPCTNSINGSRGNKRYESGSGSYGSVSSTGFYPGDDWRGDVARAIFYMDLRYSSQCEASDVATMTLLLQWNALDPVSALEDQRNDEVCQAQGNRNPFIDNPIFATRIWGGPTAQDRFTNAIADPQNFSLTAAANSIRFSATANSSSDDVLLAYTNANGSFGAPSGSLSAGNSISGGGTVLYKGPAANIPDHNGLNSGTVYKYKLWSVGSSNTYSTGIEKSISTTGGSLISLYQNSFEGTASDTWNYTASPTAYNLNDDIWDVVSSNGGVANASDGNQFWGIRDLNNSNGGGNFYHILEFQTIDISSQTNVELSFDYYAEAFESSDLLEYELLYDNVSQGIVTLFQGATGGASSGGWQSTSLAIPDAVNQIQLRLRAKQDGGSDFGGFDHVVLESALTAPQLTVSAYSPTAAQVQLTANSNGDSILLVYGEGANLNFGTASGLYSIGQSFQGIGEVAYFGPATKLAPITRLNEGADYSFAAYSFDGNSYSSPVSAGLSLPDAEGSGSAQLYFQGFEGDASDNWTLTSGNGAISSDLGAADYPPNERILSGANSWQVNNSSQSLELATVNTSSADSLSLVINLSSTALTSGNGADGADYIKIYLDIDGGGFGASPDLTINGNNNAKWGFGSYSSGSGSNTSSGQIISSSGQNLSFSPAGGGYREADAYHQIIFGLKSVSSLAIKIEASNNSTNEIWNIDDISLSRHSNALVWNGSIWKNNEAPSASTQNRNMIIYPGEDAEIDGLAQVNSLDLRNNAVLLVGSTGKLNLNSIGSSAGSLILEADNLGTGSYVGPSIYLTLQYYIDRAGWQPIAFPFSDARFKDIEWSNGAKINYAPTAGSSTCDSCNLFYYDPDLNNGQNIGTNGSTAYGTWIGVHDSNAIVSQDKGYYLFVGPPKFGTVPLIISLSGTTRSANQSMNTQDGNGGWNLLPNPFPTALDWSAKSDFSSEGFDQSYWIYNGSNYAAYVNGTGVNNANGFIPAGQAFFVHSSHAQTGAGMNTRSFGLGQSMRAANNRGRHKMNEEKAIRLGLRIDTNYFSEIALRYQLGAEDGYNAGEDALLAGGLDEQSFYFQMDADMALIIRHDAPLEGFKLYPLKLGSKALAQGHIQMKDAPEDFFYYFLDAKNNLIDIQPERELEAQSLGDGLQLVVSKHRLSQVHFKEVFWYLDAGDIYLNSFKEWKSIRVLNVQGQVIYETEEYSPQALLALKEHAGVLLLQIEYPNEEKLLKLMR